MQKRLETKVAEEFHAKWVSGKSFSALKKYCESKSEARQAMNAAALEHSAHDVKTFCV